jgi:cation transport ATPase
MYLYLLLVVGSLLFVNFAHAICPICIIAVGAGVGIAEEFGVDDTVIGLWIGALIIALAWWTVNWLIKKNWNFKWRSPIVFISYYLLTAIPFYYSGLIGKGLNKIWGMDKLLFGIIAGSILFYAGEHLHFHLKRIHSDKVYFYFQRVIVPVCILIIASGVFYLITK